MSRDTCIVLYSIALRRMEETDKQRKNGGTHLLESGAV